MSTAAYQDSQEYSEAEGPLLYNWNNRKLQDRTKSKRHSTVLRWWSLSLSWALTAFFALYAWRNHEQLKSSLHATRPQSFWYETEFKPATRETRIPMREVKFTPSLQYNESGKLYRVPDAPGQPTYVGEPSPEIDSAWHDLCGYNAILMTPDEAREVEAQEPPSTGRMSIEPVSGLYVGEPAVLHDLHCLNMIRMGLDPDYYANDPMMHHSTMGEHIEHCIDAIRLSLMCAGDMTLIPGVWSENGQVMIPDFQRTHTCRDFNVIKDWQRTRDGNNPALWQATASRLKGERS